MHLPEGHVCSAEGLAACGFNFSLRSLIIEFIMRKPGYISSYFAVSPRGASFSLNLWHTYQLHMITATALQRSILSSLSCFSVSPTVHIIKTLCMNRLHRVHMGPCGFSIECAPRWIHRSFNKLTMCKNGFYSMTKDLIFSPQGLGDFMLRGSQGGQRLRKLPLFILLHGENGVLWQRDRLRGLFSTLYKVFIHENSPFF